MDRLIGMSVFMSLMVVYFSASAHAQASEQCDQFKLKAEEYNELMRTKGVREYYRSQHREYMDKYYACIFEARRNARSSNPSTIPQIKTPPQTFKQPARVAKEKRSVQFSNNITVSSYHNFKGRKREAWNKFFKESPECMNNSGDMKVFVKCSKIRKEYLNRFIALWDDKSQSLKSPLN